jgi:formylglycine-generating enzyme required for sulfatase activity
MNIMKQIGTLSPLLSIATLALVSSCGLGQKDIQGELIGVGGREGWIQTVPFGMTTVPSGTFHMGQSDEDIAASHINYNKQVTIGGFYMDDTEITNNEYRQFVEAILTDDTVGLGSVSEEFQKMLAEKKFYTHVFFGN